MFAISPTDHQWFEFLRDQNLTDGINFWTPSPWKISNLIRENMLYFMLKAPIRKLGGHGNFVEYVIMSVSEAWKEFGHRNGCGSKVELIHRLQKYKKTVIDPESYKIGCIVLTNCVYWSEDSYQSPEEKNISFSKSIVTIKYFEQESPFTDDNSNESFQQFELVFESDNCSNPKSLVKQRVGQSNFKAKISRIYNHACCITGETCPELLEAAHIQPYLNAQSNHCQNGLLLRTDFHKLFDNGLLYIDEDYTIHISSLVKSQEYQRYNGKRIRLPYDDRTYPSRHALKSRESEYRR